ncbi:MAG TPA: hypothetical protein DCQ98_13730 [Planctomycetaceae bacterium]|nr:hypothetical protein [Planctomycetaceae bacterium]
MTDLSVAGQGNGEPAKGGLRELVDADGEGESIGAGIASGQVSKPSKFRCRHSVSVTLRSETPRSDAGKKSERSRTRSGERRLTKSPAFFVAVDQAFDSAGELPDAAHPPSISAARRS